MDSACQGVRVGCPGDDVIRHCHFSDLTIRGRNNGVHCHSPYDYLRNGDNGFMDLSDVSFRHVDIECGHYPIRVFVEGNIKLRGIRRLSFEDVHIRAGYPIEILGTPNTILEDISLRQITGSIQNDTPIRTAFVRNLELDRIRLTAETPSPTPEE